jgi:hypothetical protein
MEQTAQRLPVLADFALEAGFSMSCILLITLSGILMSVNYRQAAVITLSRLAGEFSFFL